VKRKLLFVVPVLLGASVFAQTSPQLIPLAEPTPSPRLYRAIVTSRTVQAVNYAHRGESTKVDFAGTTLMPMASGWAQVENKRGNLAITAEFGKLDKPAGFGGEYLTYVMWAISPEGRAVNLGEVLVGGNHRSKLHATTDLQAFALIVTAEPYYAVHQPSNVVVLENVVRADTVGSAEAVHTRYELIERGGYIPTGYKFDPVVANAKLPLEFFEARNAMRIAESEGAEQYAGESYRHAVQLMNTANSEAIARHPSAQDLIATSREAVQTAEDARAIAVKRIDEAHLASERQASSDAQAASQAQAEAANLEKQQAQSDAARAQASAADAQANADKARSDEAASQTASSAAVAGAEADADQARAAAQQQVQQANSDKAASQAQAEAANIEKQQAQSDAARAQASAADAQANADKARSDEAASQTASSAAVAGAEADADQARAAAQQQVQQANSDKAAMRAQLTEQLNAVLQTRDSARGLIISMSDVLFETGKYSLSSAAREKLAKVSGILLSYPGLAIAVGGYTDNVGTDAMNQKLSEKRAGAVRDYLVQQGVTNTAVTAIGYGNSEPIASNSDAGGRQQNRRVELVVSGDAIGNPATGTTSSLR
jgi:outer membrane protein OmpA-like peptidoglycan-associated protein